MLIFAQILDLESKVTDLETKLQSVTTIRPQQDPTNWLPDAEARHKLQSHRDQVTSVAFHPTHSSLASSSEDCSIKIWDWEHGQLERTLKGHRLPVLGLDYGGPKEQTRLASCSSDLTVKIWDPSSKYANVRTLCGHDHSVHAVRFLPNGNLVSSGRDGSIRVWDVMTGYCLRTIDSQAGWIRDISPSADGNYVVSAGDDQVATIWNVLSGEVNARMIGHGGVIECCAVAPATSHVYIACLGSMKLSGREMFVATGSRDSNIKLWNERGRLIKTLEGHDTWVRGLAFHPQGKFLVSVGDDRTIRCWDLSNEARLAKTIVGSSKFLSSVRWGPSMHSDQGTSHVVAIGSADNSVRIWM
jgi:platelet-activating factor acetylhydrolase IB subunit alpha